jgi:hypothetical protein
MPDPRDSPHARLSRRRFTTGVAASATGLALGGIGFVGAPIVAQTIQIGGTPEGESPAPAAPTDEIAYEAYDGILRGAQGTLSARAGNSADQAVLLGALLDATQATHRFATGPLDPAIAGTLMTSLARTGSEASASWNAAERAALLHHLRVDELPATPPAMSPEVQEVTARFEGYAQAVVDLALTSREVSGDAIATALKGGGITLPPSPDITLPTSEQQRHTWVQVADGADWIDIDPCLPPEGTIPALMETVETPPDDWYHWLRFVIAADEWRGGAVSTREVVSLSATSSRLVDVPVALSMASADQITDLGSTVNQVLSGQKTIFPSIYADGVIVNAATPVIFATDAANAQNPFGGNSGIGEGEAIAVWLQVEISRPGAEQVVIRRPLLDRLTPEDRAAGTAVAERIAPVRIVPTALGADTVEQFNTLIVIHTDVARIPPTDAFVRYGQDEIFGPVGLLGPALAGYRDLLGVRLEAEAGTWSYPSAPNVTVFSAKPGDDASGDGRATLTADLLYRQRTSLPLSGVTPATAVHPLVLSGVLDAVAEQVLLAPEARGADLASSSIGTGPSVAGIFAAAIADGQTPRLVTTPGDLAGIPLDPVARSRIEGELTTGRVVIIPVEAVDIGGIPSLGWWIVDPATGQTRDELQGGLAGASTSVRTGRAVAYGNSPGWTFLLRAVAFFERNAALFACIGGASAASFMFTGSLILLADAASGVGSMAAASAAVVVGGGGSIAGWALACA